MKTEDPFSHEEAFHEKDKKIWRVERKERALRDRSKYKKTDWDKRPKKVLQQGLERGQVLAITQDGVFVDSDGKLFTCILRGSLKQEKQRLKNLVAVGDFVHFKITGEKAGAISFVEDRHSILSRAENIGRRREQLIAVNIDQVLITVSVFLPSLKPTLIDRYLIATLKGNMIPVIVINKIDLFQNTPSGVTEEELIQERDLLEEVVAAYSVIDIPVLCLSAETGEGLEELNAIMQGKSSVFSGQSGTGKSSLINAVTDAKLRTGEVVERTRKGSHTTTTTHLLPIQGEGFCIDTPGIKSFGIWDVKPEQVQQYYPEIEAVSAGCKYQDCSHFIEPECAVRDAVEEEKISRLRFESYCALMQSIKKKHHDR